CRLPVAVQEGDVGRDGERDTEALLEDQRLDVPSAGKDVRENPAVAVAALRVVGEGDGRALRQKVRKEFRGPDGARLVRGAVAPDLRGIHAHEPDGAAVLENDGVAVDDGSDAPVLVGAGKVTGRRGGGKRRAEQGRGGCRDQRMPYLRRNLSTRPAVSRIFCLPV